MTDKRNSKGDVIPECEHGYWGGFSPKRKGKYENKELSKMYQNGRTRLYLSQDCFRLQGTPALAASTATSRRLVVRQRGTGLQTVSKLIHLTTLVSTARIRITMVEKLLQISAYLPHMRGPTTSWRR